MVPDKEAEQTEPGKTVESTLKIDNKINFINRGIYDRLLIEICTVSFGLIILFVSVLVITRQIAGFRMSALNPISRYMFIVTIFFGSAIASYNGTHIKINYFVDRIGAISTSAKLFIDILIRLTVIAFICVVVYGTIIQSIKNLGIYPGDSRVFTLGQLYLGIAIGFAIMLIYESILAKENVVKIWNHRGGG